MATRKITITKELRQLFESEAVKLLLPARDTAQKCSGVRKEYMRLLLESHKQMLEAVEKIETETINISPGEVVYRHKIGLRTYCRRSHNRAQYEGASTTIRKVHRFVWPDASPQTFSAHCMVMEYYRKHVKRPASEYPTWVQEKGGIDALRRIVSKADRNGELPLPAKSPDEQSSDLKLGRDQLKELSPQYKIPVKDVPMMQGKGQRMDGLYLLVARLTYSANSTFDVLTVSENREIINELLKDIGSEKKAELWEQRNKAVEAHNEGLAKRIDDMLASYNVATKASRVTRTPKPTNTTVPVTEVEMVQDKNGHFENAWDKIVSMAAEAKESEK